MANIISPSSGIPIWYAVIKTDESPDRCETMFKLEDPTLLIDNSNSLSNRSGVIRNSQSAMQDYITTNSINLDGKTIPS